MSLEIEVSVPAPPTINVTVEPGGAQGPAGADSIVPGPQGDPGEQGEPGPAGPSAVSADEGNTAVLGSDDLIYVPASEGGGGGGGTWGSITGTLADQTDLDAALDAKSDVGHSHAQSDVTGLTAALAAKADSSAVTTALAGKSDTGHTHAQSDVTGLVSALAAKADDAATTTALALKAPLASPAFTGTPTGITKSHVGLGNVDNTADTAKPVSTAQQTALDLKANLASPALTGNPTAPTASPGDNDTSIATTAFVTAADAIVSAAAALAIVSGSANNPHSTSGATRNSSLPKNFWQCSTTPTNWVAGDEWIQL